MTDIIQRLTDIRDTVYSAADIADAAICIAEEIDALERLFEGDPNKWAIDPAVLAMAAAHPELLTPAQCGDLIRDARGNVGSCSIRAWCADLAPYALRSWEYMQAIRPDEFGHPFDWEFCPRFVRHAVNWSALTRDVFNGHCRVVPGWDVIGTCFIDDLKAERDPVRRQYAITRHTPLVRVDAITVRAQDWDEAVALARAADKAAWTRQSTDKPQEPTYQQTAGEGV